MGQFARSDCFESQVETALSYRALRHPPPPPSSNCPKLRRKPNQLFVSWCDRKPNLSQKNLQLASEGTLSLPPMTFAPPPSTCLPRCEERHGHLTRGRDLRLTLLTLDPGVAGSPTAAPSVFHHR